MKRRVFLGTVVSIVLLVLVFRQLDINQLLLSLGTISYPPVFAAIVALMLTLVIRAWRWRYLLEPVKLASMSNLVSATSIGASMDMLLPARTGDLIRAHVIARKEQTSNVASLGTIVVEKVLDFLVILIIAFSTLAVMNFSAEKLSLPASFSTGIYIFSGLILMLCAVLWFVVVKTEWVDKFLQISLVFLPKKYLNRLRGALTSFASGLQTIKRREGLIPTIILSCLLWFMFALSNLLILRSFDLQLPTYSAFLILVFQILGVTVPSSPGFIGTYHAAVIAGLSVFGVSQELAISVAIIMHAAFFLPFILAGLFFVWKENMSFHALWSVRTNET